jgi:hypothetical protein
MPVSLYGGLLPFVRNVCAIERISIKNVGGSTYRGGLLINCCFYRNVSQFVGWINAFFRNGGLIDCIACTVLPLILGEVKRGYTRMYCPSSV